MMYLTTDEKTAGGFKDHLAVLLCAHLDWHSLKPCCASFCEPQSFEWTSPFISACLLVYEYEWMNDSCHTACLELHNELESVCIDFKLLTLLGPSPFNEILLQYGRLWINMLKSCSRPSTSNTLQLFC